MQTTIASIKGTDNYTGLPSGAGSVQELTDTAMTAVAAVFAKNVADGTAFNDNIYMVFKEMIEQEVAA